MTCADNISNVQHEKRACRVKRRSTLEDSMNLSNKEKKEENKHFEIVKDLPLRVKSQRIVKDLLPGTFITQKTRHNLKIQVFGSNSIW